MGSLGFTLFSFLFFSFLLFFLFFQLSSFFLEQTVSARLFYFIFTFLGSEGYS